MQTLIAAMRIFLTQMSEFQYSDDLEMAGLNRHESAMDNAFTLILNNLHETDSYLLRRKLSKCRV